MMDGNDGRADAIRELGDDLQRRGSRIIATTPAPEDSGVVIGHSREGRAIRATRVGGGACRLSLLGGAHADEPVGPRMLRKLIAYLTDLQPDDPLLSDYEWWILPHINPDGRQRNRGWQIGEPPAYDLAEYLRGVVRELPGDDIEFGFPHRSGDEEARPENRAAYDWWRRADGGFSLHVSLHGMAFAAGPWFLIEPAWRDRDGRIRERCVQRVAELGYVLHDVERGGDKGFFRLAPGFCTRPDSRYMREHFLALGDEETANRFRPSSMETIRALGGDSLTLVSEMPLFITPGVGVTLGPPDPAAEEWKRRIDGWKAELSSESEGAAVADSANRLGLKPMPVRDQMLLQWTFIAAGLEQVEMESAS